MGKQRLQCDICGGNIEMQAGGKHGICANCGTTYSVERMREIYSGIKVSITGTDDDVAQWKKLLEMYMQAYDYEAADKVVNKILEAVPSDQDALEMYQRLQSLKYMKISNGKLIKYNGHETEVIVPEGVVEIGANAFYENSEVRTIVLPNSIKIIGADAFSHCCKLNSISIPDGVEHIGDGCFASCGNLESVNIPKGVRKIEGGLFPDCRSLKSIPELGSINELPHGMFSYCDGLISVEIPMGITKIGGGAFASCSNLRSVIIPPTVESIEMHAFRFCQNLTSVIIPDSVKTIDESAFCGCPRLTDGSAPVRLAKYIDAPLGRNIEENERRKERESRRRLNLCQNCGGDFKGLFTKTCTKCGRQKDY